MTVNEDTYCKNIYVFRSWCCCCSSLKFCVAPKLEKMKVSFIKNNINVNSVSLFTSNIDEADPSGVWKCIHSSTLLAQSGEKL